MESGGDRDESCVYETGKRERRKIEVVVCLPLLDELENAFLLCPVCKSIFVPQNLKKSVTFTKKSLYVTLDCKTHAT